MAAVVGALCAVGIAVGSLGPWARTPVISFSGWSGLGLPLVVVAFVIFTFQLVHFFVPRRSWMVLSFLLAALTLISAIALSLLEVALSHFGSLLSLVFARGGHRNLFGSGHPVTLAWGIPVMGVASFMLMVVCVAGLLMRFPNPALPRRLRRADAPAVPDATRDDAPVADDDLYNTR